VRRPSRHVVVFGISLLCAASTGFFVALSKPGAADLAFWYEPISEDARQTLPTALSKAISADDMEVIEAISRDEIVLAFRAYPVSVAGRTAATYRVRVVDRLDSSDDPPASTIPPTCKATSTDPPAGQNNITGACGGISPRRCCARDSGWSDASCSSGFAAVSAAIDRASSLDKSIR